MSTTPKADGFHVPAECEIQEALAGENSENEREQAVTRTSNTMEESCRPKKTNKFKFRTCCEWAVIGTVIAVTWGLLTLPTIYYHMPQNRAALSDPVNNTNTSQCFPEVGSGFDDSRGTNCTSRMVNDTMMEVDLLVPNEDQNDNSTESPTARSITCREGFYLDNEIGLCLPECSKWGNSPHHVELTIQVFVILGAAVCVLSASVLLLLSCLHHERMFKFPSVFIIYQMFPLGLFQVFLLIAFTDRERLFCSKRDVVGSLEDSTPFCNIQGVVYHYIGLQAPLLWLFHILAIYCGVKFPLRVKIFEKNGYLRYVHFIMLGIAVVVPLIPVAAVLGKGGSTIATFPPFQCFARSSDVNYYTTILPASITTGTGLTFIILILHVIIQRKSTQEPGLQTQGSCCSELYAHIKKVLKLHSGEMKVLIISCYFTICSLLIITTFTFIKLQKDALFSDITDYFECEATGTLKQCDQPFSVEVSVDIIFIILGYFLFGLFPIVSLIYVLNIRELKQKISKHFAKSK